MVSHLFWQVSTEDLLQLVNISPESDLYKSLVGGIVIIVGTLCVRLYQRWICSRMMLFVHRRVPLRMVKVWVQLFMCLFCHKISSDKDTCLTHPLDFIGFLIGLLKHLTRHHARTVSRDADTQTTASFGESLGTTKWYFIHLNIPSFTPVPFNVFSL